MEVPGGDKTKWRVCLYEFIGTAFLITSINLSLHPGNPIYVGLTLMANIMIFGGLTGGHFNPAVSTGVLISLGLKNIGKNIKFYLMIVTSEILGAFFGTFVISYNLMHATSTVVDQSVYKHANMSDGVTITGFENISYLPGITSLCPAKIGSASVVCSEEKTCYGMSDIIQYNCSGTGQYGRVFGVEFLTTFIFVSVILVVKNSLELQIYSSMPLQLD